MIEGSFNLSIEINGIGIVSARYKETNELLTKKSLRDIITRIVKISGVPNTAKFLDDIKELGYYMSFKGGLSFNLSDVVTEAKADGDNFIINGYKSVVMNGPSADQIIVSARTSGTQLDENGISLFIIDANASGMDKTNYKTVDGRRASDLTFENVSVSKENLIGDQDKGFEILDSAIDKAILAISAEAVGAMEVLYKTTVEYTKTREQFGTAIGKFQVLQHRMVDMFMEYEQCKSLLYMATMKHEEKAEDAKKAISGLKYQVGKAGKFIGQQAVQLHGGMGVTDELNVGHYFKRLTTVGTIFGNTDYHLKKYTAL